MVEFNPDGSIKLPSKIASMKNQDANKMQNSRCMKVRRDIVNSKAPKSCELFLVLSHKITDHRFVNTIFHEVYGKSETPMKLHQIGDNEYKVVIGTSFRRCSECCSLVNKYRSFLYSNLIEDSGMCTFKQNQQSNFCYEDYFE